MVLLLDANPFLGKASIRINQSFELAYTRWTLVVFVVFVVFGHEWVINSNRLEWT